METLEIEFEVGVCGEVYGLVGSLAESGEGDAAVEGRWAFFFDHGVEGVGGVAIFGNVERVGHAVVLGLESDFDDFHGCNDSYSFGYTCG